jgi:hypothetical protein
MTEHNDEGDIRQQIKFWVWSGFYDKERAAEHLASRYEDEPDLTVDRAVAQKALDAEFAAKAAAERTWPKETDCDRLDRAFDELHRAGICALHNAGYTQSDGHSDVAQVLADEGRHKFRGFCFYHGQDLERAVHGGGLLIAFGDLDEVEADMIAIGRAVVTTLTKYGFKTEWDGTAKRRIDVTNIDWKRLTPR